MLPLDATPALLGRSISRLFRARRVWGIAAETCSEQPCRTLVFPEPPRSRARKQRRGLVSQKAINQMGLRDNARASLEPLRNARLNHGAVRQENSEEHLAQWSFHRVRETNQPEGSWRCAKLLCFKGPDWHMVKCRHEIGSDLSRLLLGSRHWGNSALRPRRRTLVSRHPGPRPSIGIAQRHERWDRSERKTARIDRRTAPLQQQPSAQSIAFDSGLELRTGARRGSLPKKKSYALPCVSQI